MTDQEQFDEALDDLLAVIGDKYHFNDDHLSDIASAAKRVDRLWRFMSFDRWRRENPEPKPMRLNPWGC